ncbi:hypothetical protein, partial [Mesorhizobium sp. M7A.F.Ca.CA.001.08.2.1]|uniref:hypothetical protein n=1 Tax=Mesorhizobium sp. M7A.F.Ca.CA.001.08.2.1 TaxID=2496692 RepID=UPI0019D0FE31
MTIAFGSGCDAQAASKAADMANNATVAARRRRGGVTACIFLMSPSVSTQGVTFNHQRSQNTHPTIPTTLKTPILCAQELLITVLTD